MSAISISSSVGDIYLVVGVSEVAKAKFERASRGELLYRGTVTVARVTVGGGSLYSYYVQTERRSPPIAEMRALLATCVAIAENRMPHLAPPMVNRGLQARPPFSRPLAQRILGERRRE